MVNHIKDIFILNQTLINNIVKTNLSSSKVIWTTPELDKSFEQQMKLAYTFSFLLKAVEAGQCLEQIRIDYF